MLYIPELLSLVPQGIELLRFPAAILGRHQMMDFRDFEAVGCGSQLLRNFHLRLNLQLLPAADLQLAAESHRWHLQRLLGAREMTGAPGVGAPSAITPGGAPVGEENPLQLVLRRTGELQEADGPLKEESKGVDDDATVALALPSYRLHMAAALQEDLERLGWGEHSSEGGPFGGPSPQVTALAVGNSTCSKSLIDSSTGGSGGASSTPGAACGEATRDRTFASIVEISEAYRGPYYDHQQQQQRQLLQHQGVGEAERLQDATSGGYVTPSSPVLMASSAGGATIQQLLLQQQQQQQQQREAEAAAAEEEMLILKEQLTDLQLRQQQQQKECSATAAAADALRVRVQELLEENRYLRLHGNGMRRARGLPDVPIRSPLVSPDAQERQDSPIQGSCNGHPQKGEEAYSDRTSIDLLQQKVAVYRRELMLLSDQNAQLRRRAAAAEASPHQH